MNTKDDGHDWLEVLGLVESGVAEILTQLDTIRSGTDLPHHADVISRQLFLLAKVYPQVITNAAQQLAHLERSGAHLEYAAATLAAMGRIKRSMELIGQRIHALHAPDSELAGLDALLLN
jgi:hypothetical protein